MSEISLIEKIKQDAAQAVEEIKTAGKAEVESVQRATKTEVEKLKEQHELELAKAKEHRELVAVSQAKQAGNIAVQSAKRHEINAIIGGLVEDLAGMESKAYQTFFLKRAQAVLPEQVNATKVIAPSNRQNETEAMMKELGLTCSLTENSQLTAGLIIEAKDGVYDLTLDRIISEKRAELEMVIVNSVMS
jgi:vacuolar-type H+-ATPase subunit E/Vma4